MNAKTRISRFIVPSIEFYDKLNSERLFALCEHFSLTRRYGELNRLTEQLKNGRIQNPEALAFYSLCDPATNNSEHAIRLLFELADNARSEIRARALNILACKAIQKGDTNQALTLNESGLRHTPPNDPLRYYLLNNQAVALSVAGRHQESLTALTRLIDPVTHLAGRLPDIFFTTMNSLAVELGEVGKLDEAASVIPHLLHSPIAGRYPEWDETRQSITEKLSAQRSSITVSQPNPNTISAKKNSISQRDRLKAIELLIKEPGKVLPFPMKDGDDTDIRLLIIDALIENRLDRGTYEIILALARGEVGKTAISKIYAIINPEHGEMK